MRYCFLKQKTQESFHFLTSIGRSITFTKLMQDLFLSQFNPYHSKDTLILGATIEDVVPFPPEAEDGRNPIESGKAEPAQITLQKLQQILWEVRKSAWNSFLRNIQYNYLGNYNETESAIYSKSSVVVENRISKNRIHSFIVFIKSCFVYKNISIGVVFKTAFFGCILQVYYHLMNLQDACDFTFCAVNPKTAFESCGTVQSVQYTMSLSF